MSDAHEALEHAEHASHAGHSGHDDHGPKKGGMGKYIGISMGLIGVLIAFCAAMVGSTRNDLTKTLVLQAQAHSDYDAASTKLRVVMMEVENQRQYVGVGTAATTAPNPHRAILKRFIQLYLDYAKEKSLSKTWADAYTPLIGALFESTEGYERAQLIAEVAVVIASLALLMGSRVAWVLSLIVMAACAGQLTLTHIESSHSIGTAEAAVEKAAEAYHELRKAHSQGDPDAETVAFLDPDGKIRAELEAAAGEKEAKPAEEKH